MQILGSVHLMRLVPANDFANPEYTLEYSKLEAISYILCGIGYTA